MIPKVLSTRPERKTLEKKCLKLWAELVKLRAGNRCEYFMCGSTSRLNAHHFFTKGAHASVRYEPNNGICLCYNHHKGGNSGAHCDPHFKDKILGKYSGYKAIRSEQWLELLERQANTVWKGDLFLQMKYLEQELEAERAKAVQRQK